MAIMLVSTAYGVSAFTTGNVKRSADIGVVTDSSGLIGLEDGTSSDQVWVNSSGALNFDVANNNSASGVNNNGHFEWGDPADANNTYAFNVTNHDDVSHSFTFNFQKGSSFSDGSDSDSNLQFEIYDSSGNLLDTATEGTDASVTINADTTVYVVIIVDTYGIGDTADLSGTLKISAA